MTRTLTDTFVRANGALGSIPTGVYNPAVPWEVLSGTFAISSNNGTSSTAPGSNPLAVAFIGKRSNGSCDMYVEGNPTHVHGNAIYARVVDANNWIRARIRSYRTSYQYYVTEYQHTNYVTEYEYVQYRREKEVQRAHTEWQHSRQVFSHCTYSGWTAYSEVSTTACRSTVPNTPADEPCGNTECTSQNCTQYRYVDLGTTGCTSPNRKYRLEKRTQTSSRHYDTEYTWSTSSSLSGWTATGSTRTVNDEIVWLTASGSVTAPSYATGNTRNTLQSGSNTWATSKPADVGDTYWTATGSSRQTASGTYWDTTYEAGAPTRQAGPYTDYNYFYGNVQLEKCVAGTITQLGSEYYHNSSTAQVLRLSCVGDVLAVSYAGTQRITVTDAAHRLTGTKAGFGGGVSDYNPQNPSLSSITIAGVSPERVRLSNGTWGTMNRKIRVGGQWIDMDTVRK